MQRQIIAALALILSSGCAATWQDITRKSLRGVSEGTEDAIGLANVTCEKILKTCIAQKENPCAALDKCLAVRQYIIRAAIMAQLAALAGYAAVDIADRPKAEAALSEAVRLMSAAKKAIEALQ